MPETLRVLYVDDDPGLLEIGKLFLEQSGRFSVDIITSASAALPLMNTTKFDAIISDYQMPGMDGIGFLKSVRASGNAIPFILFTGRGREEIVIQALNEGANFYLQKGGEPEAQFAELVHKIQISVEHHRAAEKIQALNRLYSVLSATNKAIFRIQTKDEFFLEICRILVETGGFRMAWIGHADLEQKIIRPVASAGHVDGYLDTINISTEDVPEGRGPTGTAFREGKYFWSNDITLDPRMEPWRENALKRGYLANAAFSFSLGTNNAGTLSVYAPVTGFFDAPIIDLLEELSVDISFYLRTIDEQAKRKSAEEGLQQEQLFSKSVLDSLPGIFYLYTYPDCRLVLWNKQHEVLLGYETGEMKGRHVTDWHAPESKESVMNAMETVMKTGQGSMDAFLLTKDGHMMPFFLTGVRFEANGELYVMGIGIDVTERKQAEVDLRASEEALSAMLNGIGESAFLMTPEGTVLAANETVARRLGMKQAEDLVGQNALKLLPEDIQMSRQIKIKEVIQSGQPVNFEDVRLGRVISQTIYPVKDPDGTVRRLAIFGVDVTDRKLTEDALHETDARLRFALRSAKSGTWDWDFPTGKLVWSPEFYELFGLPHEVPPSFETWVATLHPDDRKPSMEKIDQSVKDHKDLWNEYRVLLPEGGLRWIGAAGSTSYNDQGEPLRMSGICIDISERKQAEEALRESEARYRLLADNATDVIWTLDLNGAFTYVSPSIFQLRGYTQEEVMQQSLSEVISEGSVAIVEETIRQTLEQVKSGIIPAPTVTEVEQPCKDGSSVWTEVVSRLFIDATGNPAGFIGISRNITERRRAGEELLRKNEELNASYEQIAATEEELRNNLDELARHEQALRESEASLRAILDATPFPVALVDLQDNNINYWSRSALTLFGHTAPTADEWYQLAYPDPAYRQDVINRWKPYLELAKLSGQPVNTGEYRVTCRDGTVRICELYATFLADKLVVTFNDITDRKRAELELLSAHDRLKEAHQLAHIGTWDWVVETDTVIWSEELCNISGWDPSLPAPTYAELPRIYTPASWERLSAAVTNALNTGEPYNLELELIRPDGSIRWTHAFGSVIRDGNGKVTGLHGTVQDITESKQAEDASRESEVRLRAILDATPFPIALVDISDNNIEFWSRSALTLFGHTAPSAPEWYQIAYPDPDYRADVIARWKPYLEKAKISGETVNTGEYRVTCHDGSVRICELYASFLPDKLIVTFNDITERQQVGEALRESEETFKALAENANDGILVAVNDGAHTYANRRVCEMLGYSVAELQKSSIKDIAVPDEVAKLQERFRKRLLGEDIPQQYETSLLHKDGKIVPVEISAAKTFWHGQPADLVIIHDITERKQAEETIQHAFAERGVLLREIHHRVKNNLASIISLIGLQVASLTDPTTISLLRDLQTRIQSMALVHESLYISEDLARINFGNYTEKLARHLFDIYVTGEKIHCRIEMGDVTMPIETAIPCGLVITEIITNSLKYAFPKTFSCKEIRGESCSITLTLRREESNYLLNIADNGIGMKEGTEVPVTRSLGLYLIKLIVQYQLRGNLEICTDKGTSYTIRFPDPVVKG